MIGTCQHYSRGSLGEETSNDMYQPQTVLRIWSELPSWRGRWMGNKSTTPLHQSQSTAFLLRVAIVCLSILSLNFAFQRIVRRGRHSDTERVAIQTKYRLEGSQARLLVGDITVVD